VNPRANEMPDRPVPREAIRAGTVGLINRSAQYLRADGAELLRSLNEAWSKIRLLEHDNRRKDIELGLLRGALERYRWINITLTAIITTLAWEGVKALTPIALRWLGLN